MTKKVKQKNNQEELSYKNRRNNHTISFDFSEFKVGKYYEISDELLHETLLPAFQKGEYFQIKPTGEIVNLITIHSKKAFLTALENEMIVTTLTEWNTYKLSPNQVRSFTIYIKKGRNIFWNTALCSTNELLTRVKNN